MTEATMSGEISFDTIFSEEGVHHIEGCYRVNGESWKVFYFTHRFNGQWWQDLPVIRKDVVWPSGISGVDVVYPMDKILNKETVSRVLSDVLGVSKWVEVRGPDSLQLK